MIPWTMIILVVLSVMVVLIVVTVIVILILVCLLILKKGINLLIFILVYICHDHLGLPTYNAKLHTCKILILKTCYASYILHNAVCKLNIANFSDTKRREMPIEQPAKRDVTKEDSQSAADRSTGDQIGLQGEEKATSEGVYEEIDFTMEYNMSYSTVTQTAL